MHRRDFFAISLLSLSSCARSQVARTGELEPFFPSRAHKFIWRNWDLVSSTIIAEALQCSPKLVAQMASSLGLVDPNVVSAPQSRTWFKILSRNWDFVPFQQIAVLVGRSESEIKSLMLPFIFVGHHLGPKPECPLVRVDSADAAKQVGDYFRFETGSDTEPSYSFLKDLSTPSPDFARKPSRSPFSPRIVFPYSATYDSLSDSSCESHYAPAILESVSSMGADSIWVPAVLRDLIPSKLFSEFGMGGEARLQRLRKIIQNAEKCGLGVYLVLNEPRGLPEEYFVKYPEIRGARGRPNDPIESVCTSTSMIRDYLHESSKSLFEYLPDLEGVILLTASEAPTHCYSVHWWTPCRRCATRSRSSVVGEVIQSLTRGIHTSKPTARVIVWDWSWSTIAPDPQSVLIDELPSSATLLVDFERGTSITRGGVTSHVDEYSLSVTGPSDRAAAHIRHAQRRGLAVMAKIQVGTTWELGLLPYIPVPSLVVRKLQALKQTGITGAMMSWTHGSYPSPNWHAARIFVEHPELDENAILAAVAQEVYGEAALDNVVSAWRTFAKAFQQFPFSNPVVYSSVLQLGPAHPMYFEPTHRPPRSFNNADDLRWTSPYGPQLLSQLFADMAQTWQSGIDRLSDALAQTPAHQTKLAKRDFNLCRVVYLYWKSISNQLRFTTKREDKRATAELRSIVQEEIQLATQLLLIAESDSRIGFEPSMQYLYLPQDIRERIASCRYMLEKQLQ